MSRYPQGIRSYGASCPICGRKKYIHARLCRDCNPVFTSHSAAMEWARTHEAGPCVLIHRPAVFVGTRNPSAGYVYAEWTGAKKGAAA